MVRTLPLPTVTLPVPLSPAMVSDDVPRASVPFTVGAVASAIWLEARRFTVAPTSICKPPVPVALTPAVLLRLSVPAFTVVNPE